MADVVRFVMQGQVRTLSVEDPTRTVLDWLREDERRCGTKEGCAEGDCGACTVVLGTGDGARVHYRAVNACILFLPALDGKELVTVEDLAGPDGALHPAQRAMVDQHGSQCGFCTPGFVMSLFALYHGERQPSRARICDALAGNLCRCTGYRPIIDAARTMYAGGVRDRFSERMPETAALLAGLERQGVLEVAANGRRGYVPSSGDELAALLEPHPEAVLVAGGTDVGLWVTKQFRDLDTVIQIGDIAELKTIVRHADHLDIGAGVTITETMALLAPLYPDLGELFRRYGSVQVRNTATLGGNIANGSPIGDSMPALVALGATIVLRRGKTRRTMAMEDFFRGYRQTALGRSEFVERIHVPLPDPARRFACYKISKRFDQDISAVLGAFALTIRDARIAEARICFGGMAATPKRAARAEAALVGRAWDADAAKDAAAALGEDYEPISDFRASSRYRLRVAQNLVCKFELETSGRLDAATRVVAFEGAAA